MIRIFFEDTLNSAHFLPNVPDTHKCHNLHGHTYHVRLEVAGEPSLKLGWIVDYAEVKKKWEDNIKAFLDHRNLNEVLSFENTTCENLVNFVWSRLKEQLPGLARVEIRETAHCGAVYDERWN